jgi:hypothetical protein
MILNMHIYIKECNALARFQIEQIPFGPMAQGSTRFYYIDLILVSFNSLKKI